MHNIIEQKRVYYQKITSVYCKVFLSDVFFTSEGFNHLIYERNRKPRKKSEQYMKLMCLKYVPNVLKNCKEISNIRQLKRKIKGKIKLVFHYELIHEVSEGKKIRVIVEKTGNGKYKFLSVMPHNKLAKPIKKRR